MRKKIKYIMLIFMLLSKFHCIYALPIDVQVSMNKIALGETINVKFILKNSSHSAPDFSVLEKDFNILGTDYGNVVNMNNGVITAQTYWRITLEPKRIGELIIPPISFGKVHSEAHKIVVEDKVSESQNSPAFIKVEVDSLHPYVQSQILYKFKLYYQTQLENPQLEIPSIKEGAFIKLDTNKHYETLIKGKTYNVVEKTLAFFPHKSGKIIIPPMNFHAVFYDMDNNTSYNPFFVSVPKALALKTEPITINVKDIPSKFKGTTWLPAEKISLTEEWSPDISHWEMGDPVTRVIKIEAQGLRADQIPDVIVDNIPGVKVYPSPVKRNTVMRGEKVVGSVEQKITYISNEFQAIDIPQISLNWWNLLTDQPETAVLNNLSIQIKSKKTTAKKVTVSPQLNPVIHNNSAAIPNKPNLFYTSVWFWLSLLLAFLWLVNLWIILQKRLVLKNQSNPKTLVQKTPEELSEKVFNQACHHGDAVLAQKFILSWGKKRWPEMSLNLKNIYERIDDIEFTQTLKNLEFFIYANKTQRWDGVQLFNAFKKINKTNTKFKNKYIKKNKINHDPLPPLNPHSGN